MWGMPQTWIVMQKRLGGDATGTSDEPRVGTVDKEEPGKNNYSRRYNGDIPNSLDLYIIDIGFTSIDMKES